MKRRLRVIGAAIMTVGAALALQPVDGVDAASTMKAAWWSRASDPASAAPPAAAVPGVVAPALPAAPPRPDVPEGSLLVEGTPTGATAIAAITYTLLDGESSPILTVTPSGSSNVPADAVILACRAAIDWEAPETSPGPWTDKPLVDCGRSVSGIIADGTITFPLAPLASGLDLDVVLVPGNTAQATPAGQIGSPFSLSFDAAQGAVLTSTTASSSGSPTGGSSFEPAPASSPSFSSGTASFTPPETPVVQPALEPQEQAPSVPETAVVAAAPVAAKEDNTAQGVAFIILLIGAALAALAYFTPDRDEGATVGLGRFKRPIPQSAVLQLGPPVKGGLGRFSRPRTGAPPALS